MKQFKYVLFFLLFVTLHLNILCQAPTGFEELTVATPITLSSLTTATQKKYYVSYSSSSPDTILHLTSTADKFAFPGYLYASFSDTISEESRIYSSQNVGTNEIYIDFSKNPGKTAVYILLNVPKVDSNTITLKAEYLNKISLASSQNNGKAKFLLSEINQVSYTVPSPITYSTILIYSLGEHCDYFSMAVAAGSSQLVKKRFENGYGSIVQLGTGADAISSGTEITITITATIGHEKQLIEVGFEIVDQEESHFRTINILEHVYGATSNLQNCYKPSGNVDFNKHPVLLINAFSQAVSFVVKLNNGTKIYSQDGLHNSFIRLLQSFNDTNYFCIKKYTPKYETNEILGESSYDFQLYYEDELPNNQMNIMPLINGKIYTHSLNRGSVMAYRHNFYSGETRKIYSANLLKIRGNPKLYGYTCNTYPNCKVTKDTTGLEEIERINQYYVNKRQDAPGNTATNSNGEPVSEIRQQYMSVVICDTQESDPNYGECKYTIEINNEEDEIQLLPERVFTTSLLQGVQKFYIRISNHASLKKLNITLTVLTGNAHMKVYSNSARNTGTEITNYNYHKIFRREVFEFKFDTPNSILEDYYGTITCTEPSFIELKYVTDFHFKGFIWTNPGEVNIEYINKKGSQFPYEILNPYYYHPLDQNLNKNKDYMFKIRSKECSMFYNYNYNNMPNTKSVNMQFDRSQPYTYLTSFAFMTTVDNLNYNSNREDIDCSMLVYSGEIDSPERPLLIVSDVPLPSDFAYTYFIYPFIKTDPNGIMVEIKYSEQNNVKPSYKVTLSVKGNTIQEKNINSDNYLYINPNPNIDCGNNMQCALKIQIQNTTAINDNYLTVNVYSASASYPEIIDPTMTSGKIYIPNNGYKILQMPIGLYEGTKFTFSGFSGTLNVDAKLISKNDAKTIDNYNDLNWIPTIGSIDFSNSILTLENIETSSCLNGCELIMKISITSATTDVNTVTFSQKPIPLEISSISPMPFAHIFNLYPLYEKVFIYSYTSSQVSSKLLHISITPSEFAYPGFIYASFNDNVSEDNRMFSSQELGTNELYINLNKYNTYNKLYILVKAPKKETGNGIIFKAELIDDIELSDTNRKARFKLSHNSNVYFNVSGTINYNSILFYGLGENWNLFDMKASYITTSGATRNLNVKQIFHNGYGVIVDLNKIPSNNVITLTLTPSSTLQEETKVEVGFEYIDEEANYLRPVNILEHVYGATSNSENCYKMAQNVDLNKHPVLLINAFTQAVSFVVRREYSHKRQYSQDGFHNSFIRLLEPFDENNYFCIKKFTPKDRIAEELGESSYDFQLYYEDDLINNQMYIMPLINGKIYTHSLNRGSVMAYRHNFYSGETEKIYSANLLKIRGNPKLYGYTCNTYPYCKVTKDTQSLEEIERINQYYVNKRQDAPGNTAINSNGEPVSEIRQQYLSVVICDTEESDPNYGECKYTIEINNERDDIQLIPERVLATSILPGINFFSVRVSNYQEAKKLNISLTVLTGNAFMKVYSDINSKTEIKDYNYHKIFRKEVFEFTSSSIREIYWGEINCTEPAFIELKYVTDFHFKGFIWTNPGEVNIKYINKKGSQFPYEILNPYYYHPLDQNLNKNKDYMFKIRSSECTMFYNYNYNNMPNTNSVNMRFDRSQPYTYLTSFAFMTTVDNYTYNTKDDSTDCAMLVLSGEIDAPERPLLIVSDYPIPSDFENTYYVYPFIKKDFKGLMVDIRFTDSNIASPSYLVELSVNGVNVLDQVTMSNDHIFKIESTNDKINCGNNLQCALNIKITKTASSDMSYNLTVNVYTPTTSIPEVIVPTEKEATKLYIPQGQKKTTTISIGKNEETEIKIDFTSGRGIVFAKLLTKEEAKDMNNFIFDENSSNLINYDASSRKLKISKADSEKCDAGCELVIIMSVDGAESGEPTEVTISKTPVNTEEKIEEDDDDDKKIEPWLAAVLVVVCVLAVSVALILVYFFVLRNKGGINVSPRIEESEKEIKGKNDIVSKEQEKVINFNN